jgi:hypothetical protein
VPWIESHTLLLRHRKLIELSKDLRIKPVYAMGHLHALWHTALEQQEDGDLSSWSDELVAEASSYSSEEASQYVSLLQEHGWLDARLIHDWLDYAGRYLIRKYHNSNRRYLQEVWLKHGRSYGKSTSLRKQRGRPPPGKVRSSQVVFKSESEEGGAGGDWPTPYKLIELYNLLTPEECPAVNTVSPSRIAKAKKYLKTFPDEAFWREVFKQIHRSRFLRGVSSKFVADFDWLLTVGKDGTENAVKVHDGRYMDGRE